jgi:predicted SnoaL-like aldol condensation-catalyzing enzyme
MSTTEVEKVVSTLRGLASRNVELTTKHVNPSKFIEHNPTAADGIEGLRNEVRQLREDHRLEVVRAFQDGSYVFTQTEGLVGDRGVFFDVFRFEASGCRYSDT